MARHSRLRGSLNTRRVGLGMFELLQNGLRGADMVGQTEKISVLFAPQELTKVAPGAVNPGLSSRLVSERPAPV